MEEFDIEDNGTTPLFLASSHGHLEVVEHLLEARADKDSRYLWAVFLFVSWVCLGVFSPAHRQGGRGPFNHFPYEFL